MSDPEPNVFVIDDDVALCESLHWLLEGEGFRVRTFHSAEAFLEQYDPQAPGCLVVDIRMKGMSGIELQSRLAEIGDPPPIIIITGHGDVPLAVKAVKGGALDFLEKPVNDQVLLERIRGAIKLDAERRHTRVDREMAEMRLRKLTRREREVMECIFSGLANKQIAARLGISEKTVEVHRKRVLQKTGTRNAVELVRLVMGTNAAAPVAPPAAS
ncbi:MAG: response regulator transcription factor [Phycisphaerales bacterium]|nr:response regulator transcription factor [Phycisphaerales bacterium]